VNCEIMPNDKSSKRGDQPSVKKSKEATEGLVVFAQEGSKHSANRGSCDFISLEHGIVTEKPTGPHGVKRSAETDVIVNDGSLNTSGVVPTLESSAPYVFGNVSHDLDRGRDPTNDPSMQAMFKHMQFFYTHGNMDAQNVELLPPASKKVRVDLASPEPDYYEYGEEDEADGEYGYEELGYEEHTPASEIDNLTIGELTHRLDGEPCG
jgi:hypothetical protein